MHWKHEQDRTQRAGTRIDADIFARSDENAQVVVECNKWVAPLALCENVQCKMKSWPRGYMEIEFWR